MMGYVIMTKKEYYDVVMTIVSIGHTADLARLKTNFESFVANYTVPFTPTIGVESCIYGFNKADKGFLESLQFLPTLSAEAIKKYAEFFRKNNNLGMMMALQKYAEDRGFTVTGVLEDPEEMVSTFNDVVDEAISVMALDKNTEEYITAKEQLQSMIDQALRPEEIVVTSQN